PRTSSRDGGAACPRVLIRLPCIGSPPGHPDHPPAEHEAGGEARLEPSFSFTRPPRNANETEVPNQSISFRFRIPWGRARVAFPLRPPRRHPPPSNLQAAPPGLVVATGGARDG
uniref:Uncharacterized protein n=1 Tax=Aegilops tauschii subsp. strangulata TaxID=200361 RepID=A0A452YS44_AEGTS